MKPSALYEIEYQTEIPSDDAAVNVAHIAQMLCRAGAIAPGFAGIQYDLNSTWRRLADNTYTSAHLCDHNCTVQVQGVATGGNYVCPASLSLNHGVSRKHLTPAAQILTSIGILEKGIAGARTTFFQQGAFGEYCRQFAISDEAAVAIRETLDSPELEFNLFGGNPEMHPEILTIIRELRTSGHRVAFTTTGRRLMREPNFVEALVDAPPSVIALSADDFDDATQIHRLADLSQAQLLDEWKTVQWQRGQRQKAYEAIYVAKLASGIPEFPPLLFNMVLHEGNLAQAGSIVDALMQRFPGIRVNPFPVQSAFMHGEPALSKEHAELLLNFVDRTLDIEVAAAWNRGASHSFVPRVHYWLLLRAVFDWARDDGALAMRRIVGDGIWRCYESMAAGRYLQVGMGGAEQVRSLEQQFAGGHFGCFWNNETVTNTQMQVWSTRPSAVTKYVTHGKRSLAMAAPRPCPGCAFPRLTYDMVATESGMARELVPYYLRRRNKAFGF